MFLKWFKQWRKSNQDRYFELKIAEGNQIYYKMRTVYDDMVLQESRLEGQVKSDMLDQRHRDLAQSMLNVVRDTKKRITVRLKEHESQMFELRMLHAAMKIEGAGDIHSNSALTAINEKFEQEFKKLG